MLHLLKEEFCTKEAAGLANMHLDDVAKTTPESLNAGLKVSRM